MGQPCYLVELNPLVWPKLVRGVGPGPGVRLIGRTRVPVDTAQRYVLHAWCRRTLPSTGILRLGVAYYDSSGAPLRTPGDAEWYFVTALVPASTWVEFSYSYGAGSSTAFPAGAAYMSPAIQLDDSDTSGGSMEARELAIYPFTGGIAPLSNDPFFRDAAEWASYGTAPQFLTDVAGTPQALTLRYSTVAYMTAASDTPARTQYEARVLQPGQMRLELPAAGAGSIAASFGQITLNNADGELGELHYYGMAGQPFTVRYGMADQPLSSFVEVLSGSTQGVMQDRKTIVIRLQGRDAVLDQPMLRARYQGNNALPNGLEGNADLADQPKPLLWGAVRAIAPPCVNTSRLIWQVSHQPVDPVFVDAVYVGGVALTQGAAYTSQTDMETNAPAAGQYRVWRDGGYFRLGTAPAGIVTCNALSIPQSYGVGWWWWKSLYRMAGSAGLDVGSELQFNINATWPVPDNWPGAAGTYNIDQVNTGVWVNDARTTWREAMDQLCFGAGAWYGFIHWAGLPGSGMKFGGEIFPPPTAGLSVASACVLDASNILAVAAVADPSEGRGVPVWSVELAYSPAGRVLQPSDAPTLPAYALGLQGMPDRRVTRADSTVLNKDRNARAVVVETTFTDAGGTLVGYEASRRLALWRYTRAWFEVRVSLAALLDMAVRPRLGGYVWATWPELRVITQDGATRNAWWFTVHSMDLDTSRGVMRLVLRQATEQQT